jgi:hypothetical protein
MTVNGSSLSERLLMPRSLLLRSPIVQHNYLVGVKHPSSRREV